MLLLVNDNQAQNVSDPRQRRRNHSAPEITTPVWKIPRSNKEQAFADSKCSPCSLQSPSSFISLKESYTVLVKKKKERKKRQICSGIWAPFQVPLTYSQVANHPTTSSQGSCLTGPLCAVQEHLGRTGEKSCVLERGGWWILKRNHRSLNCWGIRVHVQSKNSVSMMSD